MIFFFTFMGFFKGECGGISEGREEGDGKEGVFVFSFF